jgi:hypothetical protein
MLERRIEAISETQQIAYYQNRREGGVACNAVIYRRQMKSLHGALNDVNIPKASMSYMHPKSS